MELTAVDWEVEVGSWQVRRILRFDVFSSRQSPVDLAEVELDLDVGFPAGAFAKGDKVTIRQGYAGLGTWTVFAGKVADIEDRKSLVLHCRDRMQTLAETPLTQTFTRVTPQEVVTWLLERAGVSDFRLTTRRLPQRDFVVAGEPVTAAIRRVGQTWGLRDFSFYMDPDGPLWWAAWEETDRYQQIEAPVLEYGANILDNRVLSAAQGVVTTYALPWVRHSDRVVLRDRRYWSTDQVVRVERVQLHQERQKARMTLEWVLPKAS